MKSKQSVAGGGEEVHQGRQQLVGPAGCPDWLSTVLPRWRWSGWPVHQLSTHGSRCRKCGEALHGWCGSSSCEEDRNPQLTFLGLNLNLKMVWRAVKLATGRFHFFHRSSGSLGSPGVLGVPESWESRESWSLKL